MIRKIKMSFKDSFYQVEWMDNQSKKSAEEKVRGEDFRINACPIASRSI